MTTDNTHMIGSYAIIEQIGSGGMATVYKAHQAKLDRIVAVKVMHKSMLQDANFLARFSREARIVARLDHPNIVPIYDYDEINGQPYLVMKYVQGQTLKEILKDNTLPLEDIQHVLGAAADALTYAHEEGVLHRDIKPSNIILGDDGTPYLTDFGLARIASQGESTLSADVMVGTPHYVSPEQAQGKADLGPRTDVYSLGIILYELVTGRVPFTADTPYAIIHKQIYAAPPPPSELNPEIPEAVEEVLLKALNKDPSERYETPNALMAAFNSAVAGENLTALDESRVERARDYGEQISDHTPGGGRYVTIPAAPINGGQSADLFQQVGNRVRDTVTDVQQQLQDRGVFRDFKSGVREIFSEVSESVGSELSNVAGAISNAKSDKVMISAAHIPGPDAQMPRVIYEDWGGDATIVRRRVQKRLNHIRGFFVHAAIYIAVVGLMMFSGMELAGLIESIQTSTDPDVVAFLDEIGGPTVLDPLASIKLWLVVGLAWGGGVLSHGLSTFYQTGRRLEHRRRVLDKELTSIHGPDWHYQMDGRSYRRVRREVYGRFKQRIGLLTHITGWFITFGVFLHIWSPLQETLTRLGATHPEAADIAAFPVLLILAFVMVITSVFRVGGVLLGGVLGANSRELQIQRELARARERSRASSAWHKTKRETPVPATAEKQKNTLDDLLAESPDVRLTGDGEFTESFAEDLRNNKRPGTL